MTDHRVTSDPGPILLQCDKDRRDLQFTPWDELSPHTDEDQVQLDVHRSFVYYPRG